MNSELKETIAAAKGGDREAFEVLYSAYRDRLFFFAKKYTGSREAAEDIVSETFITALEKLPELRDGEAFGGWLYSIAYNKCMDHCRETSSRVSLEDDSVDAVIESPVMLPDDYAVNEALKGSLRDIIDSLSPEARSAVIMYYYEEMSISEVAEAMDINENAAKQRLFRARKTIRSKVEKLVGSSVMLSAVPMGAVLNNTAEFAASENAAAGAAAVTGSAAGAVKVTGAGFAVKAAALGAAALLAVGIPVGLSKLHKGGDVRPDDSSVNELIADSSLTDDDSSEADAYSREDSSRVEIPREEISRPESIRDYEPYDKERAYAFINVGKENDQYLYRADLDHDITSLRIMQLTPADVGDLTVVQDESDWTLVCTVDSREKTIKRVATDKGWYLMDDGYTVYEDDAELDDYVLEQISSKIELSGTPASYFSTDCEEPSAEEEYVAAAVKCTDEWLSSFEAPDTPGDHRLFSHEIAMNGDSGSQVTNYLACGMVDGVKQFLVEICFNADPEEQDGWFRNWYQEGRYTAAGKYWSGYYICGLFTYDQGVCTLINIGTRNDVELLKNGLNGIADSQYRTFFDFARRPDLDDAIEQSFVPYGSFTVSKNLTRTMDGKAINVDIYGFSIDAEDENTYTAIWDKRAYINGEATYSTGLYFTDNGTGHVPDTLPKDFRLTFDNYDGDGNPDYCCRYDADNNGTYYVLDSVQTDGRIFNLSGRAYSGGIYIAGCFDPSPRLQKDDNHRYTGWKIDDTGRYYPTDENGREINLPELNMYSDRWYLPDDLKLYYEDENEVTCFVWNNTAEPVTTDGAYVIEYYDGEQWLQAAQGNTQPVTIAPRQHAEITYSIAGLSERYHTKYRIVQKSGQLTGQGMFCCAGESIVKITADAAPMIAGAHVGTFKLIDRSVSPAKVISAELVAGEDRIPLAVQKLDNGAYSYFSAELPAKAGEYTLVINGSIEVAVQAVDPSVPSFAEISAEIKGDTVQLTVTSSKVIAFEEMIAVKDNPDTPIMLSPEDNVRIDPGVTKTVTFKNAYAELFNDSSVQKRYYAEYQENPEEVERYGIPSGLSEEEFIDSLKNLISLREGDHAKLALNIKTALNNEADPYGAEDLTMIITV